jgi:dihydrodipicolinate reductase
VALQRVSFRHPGESLTLIHEVEDRRAFMPGVLLAVQAVRGLHELVIGLDGLLH